MLVGAPIPPDSIALTSPGPQTFVGTDAAIEEIVAFGFSSSLTNAPV